MPSFAYTGDGVQRYNADVAAATTDGVIFAAVPGRYYRVLQLAVVGNAAATSATLNSKPAGAGTQISPKVNVAINDITVLPKSDVGYCDTKVGEGLTVTTPAGGVTGVSLAAVLI